MTSVFLKANTTWETLLEFGRAEQALNHANKSAKLILETEHNVREYNVDAEQYPADAGKRKSDIAVATREAA
ncbi:hypothetical protein PC112_g16197 [Phytophthora cactorum]|nr:hypothetical protein PC112_g16197 [Phytophthora cactorum]